MVALDLSGASALSVARVPAEVLEPERLGAKFVVASQTAVAVAAKVELDLAALQYQAD